MNVGVKIEKIWGTTEALVYTPLFELHRLVIKPAHRCSMHMHRFKHNAFYVLSGYLIIDTELDRVFCNAQDHQFLSPGQTYTIAPGIKHQFRTADTGEFTTALEMYFTEPLSEDIIRSNIGGPT